MAFHHGPLPVDYMYLVAYTYLKTGVNKIVIYSNKYVLLYFGNFVCSTSKVCIDDRNMTHPPTEKMPLLSPFLSLFLSEICSKYIWFCYFWKLFFCCRKNVCNSDKFIYKFSSENFVDVPLTFSSITGEKKFLKHFEHKRSV